MVITLSHSTPRAYEFACHSAACRPPGKNGGTGGSTKSGSGAGGAVRVGTRPGSGLSGGSVSKGSTPPTAPSAGTRRRSEMNYGDKPKDPKIPRTVNGVRSTKSTATPENFPRGDQRKGPPHSQTFISGQQKNSPWNLTVTKGRGKTVIGKGRPVTKDGGFYGAKLIKAKPKLTGLGREPKFKEPTPIPSKAQRDASRKKSNEAYDAMPKSSKEILRRIAEWNSKP